MELEWFLDSLAELTGLSGEELEGIASEVKNTYSLNNDTFFSIKQQVLLVCGAVAILTVALVSISVLW